MTKTEASFLFSVQQLFAQSKHVYFWTLTFKKVYCVWQYPSAWRDLHRQLLNYCGKIRGVRVMEYHTTHGCHFHLLIDKRIPISVVRRLGKRAGYGIVWVVKADEGAGPYLAKYLSKDEGKMHGCHRWSTIGRGWATRKNDIVVQSSVADAMREAYRVCKEAGLNKGQRYTEIIKARNRELYNTDSII